MTGPRKQRAKAALKPLTPRQTDVLSQIAFGEVEIKEERFGSSRGSRTYMKPRDRLGVDVSSVVRILKRHKFVRTMHYQQPPEKLPNGTTEYYYPFSYYVLTPAGYTELAKYPERWNV